MAAAPNRYELLERIATGGMAEVFRARSIGEHGFEKKLAIKRILPSLASDDEFVGRFIAEAKLAVALTHTNIVQIFDFGRFGGSLYIAMEFVEGGDLANLLRALQQESQPMPVSVALFVSIELAKGLDYAHRRAAQAVVHRDISPSNILLSYAGEVKIADFGIAQAIEHAKGVSDSRIMGKWRYMSPEQARGDTMDARTDVFSAGAVMFEMFTGRKLVPGPDPETIVKNLQGMTFPAASSLRSELPSGLDEVLAKALARAPEDRYGHIEELMEALTEISYSRAVRTSSRELGDLMRRFLPPLRLDTTTRGRVRLLDDIIKSELGKEGREGSDGSEARRTEAGTEAPAPQDDAAPDGQPDHLTASLRKKGEDGAAVRPSAVTAVVGPPEGTTFVPGEPDARGVTTWRLAEPAGSRTVLTPRQRSVLRLSGLGAVVLAVGVVVVVGARREPPPPPVPRALATVVVTSEPPGAEVILDRRRTGRRTPVSEGLGLQPGPHRVGVTLHGYQAQESPVELRAGDKLQLPFTLLREPRILAIASTPSEATVRIDGVPKGVTPLEMPDLSAGPHEVLLDKRGFESWHETVPLPESGRKSLAPILRETTRFGRVTLLTPGTWADVYVDGAPKPRCRTQTPSCKDLLLPVGPHRLRFDNPASKESTERLVVIKVDHNDPLEVALGGR